MKTTKKIFISPLSWGLGHATRIIPIIHSLLKYDVKIYIGANKSISAFLQSEFSDAKIQFLHIPDYSIRYGRKHTLLKLFLQVPLFFISSILENIYCRILSKKHEFDVLISDNRYGIKLPRTKSIMITHQTNLILPESLRFVQAMARKINHFLINRFDEIWVPDFSSEPNLTGELSHNYSNSKIKYIDPLSRFTFSQKKTESDKILIILSGPEPQRTILENILINQISDCSHSFVLIRGTNKNLKSEIPTKLEIIHYANSVQLERLIKNSKLVISRSGYSTVMDLFTLKKKALFIPTPQQTEQEYLAIKLKHENLFYCVLQKDLNLQKDIPAALNYTLKSDKFNTSNTLEERIKFLMQEAEK